MPATEKLRDQRVLEVDLMGDTLVVLPAGDAVGFGLNVVNNEVAKVLEVAKSSRVKHLIIDLGRANYFGSVMIGEFMRLGTAVRERGGRIALCGASADMQDVLRIMKLDTMWEVFPRSDDAVRAIARVPFREHLWRKRRWFAAAFVIVLGVGLYFAIPRPKYEVIYYPEVRKLWNELNDLRRRKASDTEWDIFTDRAKTRLAPIVSRLERYANADRPAARDLLWVARDSIPAAIAERNHPGADINALLGDQFLDAVEALIHGRAPAIPAGAGDEANVDVSPESMPPASPPGAEPKPLVPEPTEPVSAETDSAAPASAASPESKP
jgi:anti-anti-sigma factor